MKKLPVGIESFSEIIEKDYYYIDKTYLIKDLITSGSKVTLLTRPRRFGKSLNMSMLKMFLEIETNVSLFNSLAISKEKELCKEYQGKFPVICISLKDVDDIMYEGFIKRLKAVVSEEVLRFSWLMDSSQITKYDKKQLNNILIGNFDGNIDLQGSIRFLSKLLYQHYNKKVIVLIDEYDVPLDKAYQSGCYDQLVKFIRVLFSSTLKTNNYLEFAILTGCLRISKESIFTGLNNFRVATITDNIFSEYFGFTNKEVKEMLEYYGLANKYPLFKKWYNGYKFGNNEIYCPWDVINQCQSLCEDENAVMKSYWINSSGNSIVKDIIKSGSKKVKEQLEALVSGDSIKQEIMQELTYSDLDETDNELVNLWSLLYATGYLTDTCTPIADRHTLIIPNLEIYKIYEKQIMPLLKKRVVNSEQWKQFCQAVTDGNAIKAEEGLNYFLFNNVSVRDTSYRKDIKENFYHGFLLQTLAINDMWYVVSNVESGMGYPDILVEDEKRKIGWIFELKYVEEGKNRNLEQACEKAIQQIKDNDYTAILKRDGMEIIYEFGIAFCRKKCKIVCKQLKI